MHDIHRQEVINLPHSAAWTVQQMANHAASNPGVTSEADAEPALEEAGD